MPKAKKKKTDYNTGNLAPCECGALFAWETIEAKRVSRPPKSTTLFELPTPPAATCRQNLPSEMLNTDIVIGNFEPWICNKLLICGVEENIEASQVSRSPPKPAESSCDDNKATALSRRHHRRRSVCETAHRAALFLEDPKACWNHLVPVGQPFDVDGAECTRAARILGLRITFDAKPLTWTEVADVSESTDSLK